MTAQPIGRKRLDMTADRIEACCASHMLTGHVWGGTVSDLDVVFTLSVLGGISDSALDVLREETELSLGLPVTIGRDGAFLLACVMREWPPRLPPAPAQTPAPMPAPMPETSQRPAKLAWIASVVMVAAGVGLLILSLVA